MKTLTGIRVVNMALNLPGPAAAQRLCRMGAEVVKVEAPSGDPMAIYHSGWYQEMAAGQTLVRLDLKSGQDRIELDRLLDSADLLISATRPTAMAALEPHFKKRLEDALAVATPDQYRAAFAGKSSAFWQEWGQQQDVPIETVLNR